MARVDVGGPRPISKSPDKNWGPVSSNNQSDSCFSNGSSLKFFSVLLNPLPRDPALEVKCPRTRRGSRGALAAMLSDWRIDNPSFIRPATSSLWIRAFSEVSGAIVARTDNTRSHPGGDEQQRQHPNGIAVFDRRQPDIWNHIVLMAPYMAAA
jgi:hypothetical protein